MSREIDFTKPLSAADEKYLRDRGRLDLIARAEILAEGGEDYASRLSESGVVMDPNAIVSGSGKLPLAPNTGDVNSEIEEVLSANEPMDYDAGAYTMSQLQSMDNDDLDELLEARGLPRTGLQSEKISRLLSAQGQNIQRDVGSDEGKLASGYDEGSEDEGSGDGSGDGMLDYDAMEAPELRERLRARGLSESGNTKQMVKRLRQSEESAE